MKKFLVMVSVLSVAAVSQATLLEAFEDDTIGMAPGVPWVMQSGTNETTVIGNDGDNYLKTASAAFDMPGVGIMDGQIGTLSFDLYVPAGLTNPDWSIGITDVLAASVARGWTEYEAYAIVKPVSGSTTTYSLQARSASSNVGMGTINADTWYTISLVLDNSIDKYDLYLDGIKKNTNPLTFRNSATAPQPNNLTTFKTYGATTAGQSRVGYIDNITLVVPEPATMVLLGIGSLLAIRAKRS